MEQLFSSTCIYITIFQDESDIPSQSVLDSTLPVHTPYWVEEPSAFAKDVSDTAAPGGGVRATWIGHATVLAEIGSTKVITDPIFSDYASPVQFGKFKRYRPPACSVSQLPSDLAAVVISHTHYDHLVSHLYVQKLAVILFGVVIVRLLTRALSRKSKNAD
jgi:hypothetical protein